VASADGTRLLTEFVARKARDAIDARLERWVTDSNRHTPELRSIGNAWSRELIDGDFYLSPPPSSELPSTSLVFVESREGNTVAKDPASLGGGEVDKHVIYEGLSRVAADAVMAGAETIRGGKMIFSVWRPELVELRNALGLPRHPIQIVATLRGLDVDQTLLFNEPSLRVLLLTVPKFVDALRHAFAERPWITPIVMDDPANLRQAFQQMRSLGVSTISCVGGRTLARQLLAAGLVQDVYLTKSPKSAGEPNTPLTEKPLNAELVVRKRGTGRDTGVTFEHLRPNPSGIPTS
jgi:riboflavin biosynthesis pyrimidine reductase